MRKSFYSFLVLAICLNCGSDSFEPPSESTCNNDVFNLNTNIDIDTFSFGQTKTTSGTLVLSLLLFSDSSLIESLPGPSAFNFGASVPFEVGEFSGDDLTDFYLTIFDDDVEIGSYTLDSSRTNTILIEEIDLDSNRTSGEFDLAFVVRKEGYEALLPQEISLVGTKFCFSFKGAE